MARRKKPAGIQKQARRPAQKPRGKRSKTSGRRRVRQQPLTPENAWLAHVPATPSAEGGAESSPRPHITFIHGIANKPAADLLLQSWISVLAENHGVDLAALGVTTSMVYWADVLYAEPWVEATSAEESLTPPVPLPRDWQDGLPLSEQIFVEALRGKLQVAEAQALPELSIAEAVAGGAEERIPLPWFVKRRLMERLLRDVHHYLFNVEFSPRPGETYLVRDEIRRRFVTALQGITGRPHIVVAHSLGTVIAYDCLKRVAACPAIDALLTIGSPLGLDEIQDKLRPEWTRHDGFPAKLSYWTNVFDRLDPVCGFDPQLANDYQCDGVRVIEDIHEPNSGWFRHPVEKYLRGPLLHGALVRAISRRASETLDADFTAPAIHAARKSAPSTVTGQPVTRGHAMPSAEKASRLTQFFHQIASADRLESLRVEIPAAVESARESAAELGPPRAIEPSPEAAESAVEKLQTEQPLDEVELLSLEAIVLPRERPVVFIENDTFPMPESPWEHFVQPVIRTNIERAIPAVGRVELPSNPSIPFGGTAFVVGPGLLMTNRHVAELFAAGIGRNVTFRAGHDAAWDYRRERSSPPTGDSVLEVKRIVMIHPYWDMALVEVAGLLPVHEPLRLSVVPPEELAGREVAVIGYPAKDWRNESELQDRIFGRVYNVKRLQPGKIVTRESIRSFQNNVPAMTHDSSTLGGNSGSAVIDVQTGEVVGLHFAGLYLKANYAVPAHELARDPHVVAAGVNFGGAALPSTVAADPTVARVWREIEPRETRIPAVTTVTTRPPLSVQSPQPTTTTATIRVEVGGASFSLPVQVSVVRPPGETRHSEFSRPRGDELLEGLKQPKVFPRLDKRAGYDPAFLELDGGQEVPLPKLTAAGKEIVARLDGGSPELKYHKFSIVLHKLRRMALFTAANVDWRDKQRKINGKKPSRNQLNGFTTDAAELWVTDERIPANQQLPDKFYSEDGGFFQKGHVVRRDDVCWGSSFADMQKANGDTFHTTNCTPQLPGFNMANRGEDNWGDLENLIQAETGAERVIVLAGPVLNDEEDLRFEGVDERGEVHIQIPTQFWKIIVAKGASGPEAFGFVLEQDLTDVPLEFNVPARWRRYLRKISDIEKLLFGQGTLDALEPFDQFGTSRGRRLTGRVRR